MLEQKLRSVGASVVNTLLPSTCLICDVFVARNGGCCSSCWAKLQYIRYPLCPVMGSPFSVDMGEHFLCAEAIANPPPFDRLRAVLIYDELAGRLVSSIKNRDRGDLVPWVSRWMHVAGKELLKDADVILPVPLHPSRLRKRRFNQSAELARSIGRLSGVNYAPELLIRQKPTRQQVGLSRQERERNVSGAFTTPEFMKIHLKKQRVVLVDDVYTTGATVKSAVRALRRGGAGNIDVLVFAKVETHPN